MADYQSNAFDLAGGYGLLPYLLQSIQAAQQARQFQNLQGQQMGSVPWIADANTDYQGGMADAIDAALAQNPWLASPVARDQALGPLASAVAAQTGMPVGVAQSILQQVAPASGGWSGVSGRVRQMPGGQFTNLTDTAAMTGIPSQQKQQQDVLNQQWRDTFDVGRQQTAQSRADAYRASYLKDYGVEPPAAQVAQMAQANPSFAQAPEGWYGKLVGGYNAMKQNLGASSLNPTQWMQNWTSQTGLGSDIGQAIYQKGMDYIKQYGTAAPESVQNTWLTQLLRGQTPTGQQGATGAGQQMGAGSAPGGQSGFPTPGPATGGQSPNGSITRGGQPGYNTGGILPSSLTPGAATSGYAPTAWQRLLDQMQQQQWQQQFGEGTRRFDIGAGQQLLDLQSRLRGPENYYQYMQTLENAQGTPQLGYSQELTRRGPAAFGGVGPSSPATIGGLVGQPGTTPFGGQQPGGPFPAPPSRVGGQMTGGPSGEAPTTTGPGSWNPRAMDWGGPGSPTGYNEQPYNATRQGGGLSIQGNSADVGSGPGAPRWTGRSGDASGQWAPLGQQQRQPSALESARNLINPTAGGWGSQINYRDYSNWSPTRKAMTNSALEAQGYSPSDWENALNKARPQGQAATFTRWR